MIAHLHQLIEQMGYPHPLHPAATHIPVGCIIAGFLFLLVSRWSRKPAYFQSARHCMVLALLFLPVTALLGYIDWQQNYGGAMIAPIKFKLVLAAALFVCLLLAVSRRRHVGQPPVSHLFVYNLCVGMVVGIGYFGGELVYGAPTQKDNSAPQSPLLQKGTDLYQKKCALCHYSDQTKERIGPGLKGITARPNLPTSGWVTSEENLRKQLRTPYAAMPSFENLSDQEIASLIVFLKSL